jgi:hypothetical protein
MSLFSIPCQIPIYLASLMHGYYKRLSLLPQPFSTVILLISTAVWLTLGMLAFIFLYEPFYWGSWKALFHAPGVNFYIGEIVGHWIQSFRDCWLWSSIAFGPLSADEMYYYTLLCYWQEYPWLVVYNLLLTLYVVISLQYFGLILKALILKKKVLNVTVHFWHTLLGMLLLIAILIIFVWCPPVFGFGVPYHFNNILHPWQDILDAYPECFDNDDEVCSNCLDFVSLCILPRTSTCFNMFFCLSILFLLAVIGLEIFKEVSKLSCSHPKYERAAAFKVLRLGLLFIVCCPLIFVVIFKPEWYQQLIEQIGTWAEQVLTRLVLQVIDWFRQIFGVETQATPPTGVKTTHNTSKPEFRMYSPNESGSSSHRTWSQWASGWGFGSGAKPPTEPSQTVHVRNTALKQVRMHYGGCKQHIEDITAVNNSEDLTPRSKRNLINLHTQSFKVCTSRSEGFAEATQLFFDNEQKAESQATSNSVNVGYNFSTKAASVSAKRETK